MTPTQIAILFIGICIIAFFTMFIICLYCCFVLGARSDTLVYESNKQKGEIKSMNATCEYCYKWFEWKENNAICKYKYGSRFIVHCPYCDKLTKVDIDK